jgi:CrcB protein
MALILASLAGAGGALVRYLLTGYVQNRTASTMPVGTATVNLIGAFALGVVLGIDPMQTLVSGASIGFLGGFTTFSTWMVESARLGVAPKPTVRAVVNVMVVAVSGVALAALGYHLPN